MCWYDLQGYFHLPHDHWGAVGYCLTHDGGGSDPQKLRCFPLRTHRATHPLTEWMAFGVTSILADLVSNALHLWITLETQSVKVYSTNAVVGSFIILFPSSILLQKLWWFKVYGGVSETIVSWKVSSLWSEGMFGQTHKQEKSVRGHKWKAEI